MQPTVLKLKWGRNVFGYTVLAQTDYFRRVSPRPFYLLFLSVSDVAEARSYFATTLHR
jgi:hypothetical protein